MVALGESEIGSPQLAFVDIELGPLGRISEVAVVRARGGRVQGSLELITVESDRLSSWLEDSIVVAHNGDDHDFPRLRSAAVRLPATTLDSLQWSRVAWPLEESHALPAIARLAGVALEERHHALPDALALAASFGHLHARCLQMDVPDRVGVRQAVSRFVPSAVLDLMLGTALPAEWTPRADGWRLAQSTGVAGSGREVVVDNTLHAERVPDGAVVASPDLRGLRLLGLTGGWLLRGDRVIDAAAVQSQLAGMGWTGAVAVRVLSVASGAVGMWPASLAARLSSLPVLSADNVTIGGAPWLTDLESLPSVADGRPVVLDDAVGLLLDTECTFDPGTYNGSVVVRVTNGGRSVPELNRLWKRLLGSLPEFSGADPTNTQTVEIASGLNRGVSPERQLARTAAVAATCATSSSTLLVTTVDNRRAMAGQLAGMWRAASGSPLLRPGLWPTFAETIDRLGRETHLVVTSTVGAPRVAGHVQTMVVDRVGAPSQAGGVIERMMRESVADGADPYGEVIEPTTALRLLRLVVSGPGRVILCDPMCDNPVARRALGGVWTSSHISTLERSDLGDLVSERLLQSSTSSRDGGDIARHVRVAVERLLGASVQPRQFQTTVLNSLIRRQNVLGVFRTGQGKSLCYQALGLALGAAGHGVTLVISPLVALQRDQVAGLQSRGVWEGTFVNGDLHESVRQARLRGIANGFYTVVLVAPEGLFSTSMQEVAATAGLAAVAVDEAHCISEMGHDFRPDFRLLPIAIRRILGASDDLPLDQIPNSPRLVALTGTASPAVRSDIDAQLGGGFVHHIDSQFVRPELKFALRRVAEEPTQSRGAPAVLDCPERLNALADVLERTATPTIIYAATQAEADSLATWVRSSRNLSAVSYHAGLTDQQRRDAELAFRHDDVDVICATNAFGMGVDKPNVRSVIHWRMPGSPESLYQEAGRAGRGLEGRPADCVVLYHPADLTMAARIRARSIPSRGEIESVWATLVECSSLQGQLGTAWVSDADVKLLSGLRSSVDVSVCLAHLTRAGLVTEIDRGVAGRNLRAAPGEVGGLTEIEVSLVAFVRSTPDVAEAACIYKLLEVAAQRSIAMDVTGARVMIRGLVSRGGLVRSPDGALIRSISADPAETTRRHLLLCHAILRAALEEPNSWTNPRPRDLHADVPRIVAAVETLVGLDFVKAGYQRADGSPPGVQPKRVSLEDVVALGKAASAIVSTALAGATRVVRCDYESVAAATGSGLHGVRSVLVAAHHASAIELNPQDRGRAKKGGVAVLRQLRIADVDDPTKALGRANLAAEDRLSNDQLRRLALEAYADLAEDPAGDVRQRFLESYFTDPRFLDDLRDARLNRDVCAGLDLDQFEAVTFESRRVAVVAGAGTGKTRTLTRRIAYRTMVGGVLADRVLAVCFGTDAANEMKVRLAALGVHAPVRTLNSLGLSIINDHWPVLGYASEPATLDDGDRRRVFKTVAGRASVWAQDDVQLVQHATRIALAKSMMLDPDQLAGLPAPKRTVVDAAVTAGIYADYEAYLFENCMVDFGDHFLKALLIMEDEQSSRHVRSSISELFIDEAQDLDPAQWQLLMQVGTDAAITAVGDPRQAIYQWRGAEPSLFEHFRRNPTTTELPLRYNYRSGAAILNHANRLVAPLQLPALMPTMVDPGEVMAIIDRDDAKLVQCVQRWLAESVPDDQIAVLVRTGESAQRVAGRMRRAGLAVREVGLPPLHKTLAFRLATAGLPPLDDGGRSISEAMEDLGQTEEVISALQAAQADADADPMDDWHRLSAALDDQQRSGLDGFETALNRVRIESGRASKSDSGVWLSTIHKAKGLEWDAVALVDVDPKSYKVESDEDRLVLYVAITRARLRLAVFTSTTLAPLATEAGFVATVNPQRVDPES